MTSSVNPELINGLYPVAGQDNDSQGFRDNFTNIKNNFTYTKGEIEDLQSKVVLKSALTGGTLNNDFNNAEVKRARISDFREKVQNQTATTGTVTFSHAAGHFHTVAPAGNMTFAFSNFPPAGTLGRIRVQITVSNIAHVITLPSTVTTGTKFLSGYMDDAGTKTLHFNNTGNFIYEFTSIDAGASYRIMDLSTPRRIPVLDSAPTAGGSAGDAPGMMGITAAGDYLYIAIANYGAGTVWKKVALSSI